MIVFDGRFALAVLLGLCLDHIYTLSFPASSFVHNETRRATVAEP